MRLPTAERATVSGTGWHSGKEGDEKTATRGSPPPDADARSLLHLDEFATVATPHTAAPFTADKKAARTLGTGVKGITAVATVAAPAGHSLTVETLAKGKEAEQVEDVGVEVVPALPASPSPPGGARRRWSSPEPRRRDC